MTTPDDRVWQRKCRRVFALLKEAGISEREDRLNLFRWILSDPTISSTNDLNIHDLNGIGDTLAHWQYLGELKTRAREHTTRDT